MLAVPLFWVFAVQQENESVTKKERQNGVKMKGLGKTGRGKTTTIKRFSSVKS